ncbi:MAG: Cache 3/Cache 2 fusion domain-containing protein [Clostridium beijerinckii]|jgi:signal transduction histidine kinase|uniref:histidine kinase n=1 Tax=Clostridium diolis TaxID=223919 RepID=A0AAV3W2W7_9CLOT|nr:MULTISPECIES: Cache 3/Cache 2 fusion domain-containing protein [Clostridium]MCI1581380.1 Cache 3/Cache 2 fusion domain-containing protein [Clostridium beijerinckii]AVK51044.1 histidine kinase [Clostridium sp. MF28]MCI1585518.1 Cache 3/Cache 2 fusion domain-containing protein [Clostridium beijerinckii]MCI1624919.1 Cache 3/Cache 2 fusion domain-containing protein [Clostridium beijerinckii]PSM55017.1 HAMP domain-containing protein [Clostridium diolis]
MRIKYKLIVSYLILIVFAVSVLGLLIGNKSNKAVFKEVNEKSQRLTESIITTLSVRNDLLTEKSYGDLNFANNVLNNLADMRVDYNEIVKVGDFNLPVLYSGNQRISLDNTIVDKLKQSTGTIATMFLLQDDKLIRVSTTVFNNGNRILGTYISSDTEAYKKTLNNEEYIGDIRIEGIGYLTRMKPLLDKDKKVIGAIGLGNKISNDYLDKTLSNIKLGKTGYAYVLDSEGNVILHPSDSGKNVSDYDFVQKMHTEKSGMIEYTYNGVKKIGYYQYFEAWHWYVVTTADYEELNSSAKSILTTTIATGGIIIVLGGIIALFLANTLVKPINKLKSCMEIAGKGDLTIRCNIDSKDEIGVLANSFNDMIAENKRLLEETVQYEKLKTEFIANMSHELRTPLNIIFSTAQLFNVLINRDENLNTEKMKNYTNSIKQNCYRLVRLVNNLIDITKIDSGYMKLELKNGNIVQVVEDITQSTAEYVEYMSRTIIFDTDNEEKIMAFDEEKLERILLNLISNATKFTEPGDKISVNLYDMDDHIVISVKDTGRGIPEEKVSQLFQRFKQVERLLNRSHEGSGIGLSIVKALVEMHEGTIEVKSVYGEGTEFIICLPVKIVPEDEGKKSKNGYANQSKVENINIEFSDIYS